MNASPVLLAAAERMTRIRTSGVLTALLAAGVFVNPSRPAADRPLCAEDAHRTVVPDVRPHTRRVPRAAGRLGREPRFSSRWNPGRGLTHGLGDLDVVGSVARPGAVGVRTEDDGEAGGRGNRAHLARHLEWALLKSTSAPSHSLSPGGSSAVRDPAQCARRAAVHLIAIVFVSVAPSSIHGFIRGRKTPGSPRAQMPLCWQRSGFQMTVISPFV